MYVGVKQDVAVGDVAKGMAELINSMHRLLHAFHAHLFYRSSVHHHDSTTRCTFVHGLLCCQSRPQLTCFLFHILPDSITYV